MRTRGHVVQEGETLALIAEREGVDSTLLAQLNGLDDPNLLLVGMTIKVPLPATSRPAGTQIAGPDVESGPAICISNLRSA